MGRSELSKALRLLQPSIEQPSDRLVEVLKGWGGSALHSLATNLAHTYASCARRAAQARRREWQTRPQCVGWLEFEFFPALLEAARDNHVSLLSLEQTMQQPHSTCRRRWMWLPEDAKPHDTAQHRRPPTTSVHTSRHIPKH